MLKSLKDLCKAGSMQHLKRIRSTRTDRPAGGVTGTVLIRGCKPFRSLIFPYTFDPGEFRDERRGAGDQRGLVPRVLYEDLPGPCGGRHCIGDDDSASEVSGLRGCQMYIVRSLWTDVFRRWIYCHTSQEQSMKSAGGGEGSQNRCQCTTTAMALS